MNWRSLRLRALLKCGLVFVLILGLFGCGDRLETPTLPDEAQTVTLSSTPRVSEVSPPTEIQKLRQVLDRYQPQVEILSPQPEQILETTTVPVKLQVRDLPLFKNADLDLGPHLNVILDNQTYTQVYNPDEPLILEDLTPGTHTLRVFAVRPWEESFKNEGAYAQTTFHLFAKTQEHSPKPDLPLLTYNAPRGSYGAEPILVDFYLTNAPLHWVAREQPDDEIADWRIRVTVNGESFTVDRWDPLYLKGFKPGQNWVQLEFLDETGNPVENPFNNTVRAIAYQPRGKDPLSRLIRGDLSAQEAIAIVDPTYNPPEPKATPIPQPQSKKKEPLLPLPKPEEMPVEVVPESEPIPIPEAVEPSPASEPTAEPTLVPETPEAVEPAESAESSTEPEPEIGETETEAVEAQTETTETPDTPIAPEDQTESEIEPEVTSSDSKESITSRFQHFFDRFRRPATPVPSVEPSSPPTVESAPAVSEPDIPETTTIPPVEQETETPIQVESETPQEAATENTSEPDTSEAETAETEPSEPSAPDVEPVESGTVDAQVAQPESQGVESSQTAEPETATAEEESVETAKEVEARDPS
ncbi:hypothetical protein [Oxynema sp. CENA135]|uniref:hypothetical protein n=1 Tax=Oxynema sp. CENA135 TaxID=984206 RepID=UPI00351C0D8A